jgi:3-oxoadipate enol-lactonase
MTDPATGPVDLHHVVEGPADAPPVLLGSSLGTTHAMWDELAADLARDFRVVRFDTRGHGASPAPASSYTVGGLAADVVTLADTLGIDRFAYVGLSLGGAIGQVLGIHHGERLTSLALCCTAPVFGSPDTWKERAAQVRSEGVDGLVAATLERWFTPEYRTTQPDRVAWVTDMFRATPPDGYAGCCDALGEYDVSEQLAAVTAPTLVIAGADDPGTPPSVGATMVEAIPGSRLEVIDDAAHIANVAQPEAFNAAVRHHLSATVA